METTIKHEDSINSVVILLMLRFSKNLSWAQFSSFVNDLPDHIIRQQVIYANSSTLHSYLDKSDDMWLMLDLFIADL